MFFYKITIPQWIKNVWQWIKDFFTERPFEGVTIVFFVVIFVLLIMRIVDYGDSYGAHWLDEGLGTDGEPNAKHQTLRSLALGLAGLVGLLGLFISNRRAKAQAEAVKEQAKSVDAQVKANENTTFHEAIKHLGDLSASVRLGGIYALYDLALFNPEKRLKNIIEILSAHVRETTQEKKYQEKYEKKPSNEISSLLKLLSDLNTNYLSENKKLFENEKLSENEEEKWYPLDLSHAYLCGIILQEVDFRKAIFRYSNFEGAYLYKSNFANANLYKSNFANANLYESNFANANLYESKFEHSDLVGSDFSGAILIGSRFALAKLKESHFEGASLHGSRFEGASLHGSRFTFADLSESHFAGAFLSGSYFEGAKLYLSNFALAKLNTSHFESANLRMSNFLGANLDGVHFTGANLDDSHFEGAYLDRSHFEGTNLDGAHFTDANLYRSHFEGANLHVSYFAFVKLSESHFEGAYDNQDGDIDVFMDRIQKRIGKKANIGNTMFFEECIKEKYIGNDIKNLEDIIANRPPHFTDNDKKKEFNKRMNSVIERLKQHKDLPIIIRGVPERLKNKISLGELTKERADKIIKQYEEIMKIHDEIKKKNK